MPLRVLALLLLAGCATAGPRPWTVKGTVDSATATQALAIVAAAQRVMPGKLDGGREIVFLPEIDVPCYGVELPQVITGCIGYHEVYVKWPHPLCPSGADLTCSAEPHELCHLAVAGNGTEADADACAAEVVAEYRRSLP